MGTIADRLRQKPYEQRVCKTENYPHCLMRDEQGRGMSVEQYADFIHDLGQEVQVVDAFTAGDRPRFRSRLVPPGADGDDRLRRFVALAHERDILVLTYYPMTRCPPLKQAHPDWLMRYLDEDRPREENPGFFCLNSPYRDWLPAYLAEFIDHLDLDGFYFDGTNWGSHSAVNPYFPSCCCPHCARLFKDQTGLEVPTRVDFDSLDFRRFLVWRTHRLRDFMVHVTRKVRQAHADAILDFNHYAGVYNNWGIGHPANPLGLEKAGGHLMVERTIYDGTGLAAKYVRAHGAGGSVWLGPTQSLSECATHTAPCPEPLTTTLDMLTIMANGARPVLAMLPYPSPLFADFMRRCYSEARRRVPYLEGETVKYAALHWSQQTMAFHRPVPEHYDRAADCFRRLRGTYEILNQSHLLVDLLFDEQISAAHLSAYKVLVLSNSACLSDAQCATIRRFVQGGGTLVATHETSLYDELGRARENFGLADVMGVDYQGPAAGGRTHGVVQVPHDDALRRAFGHVVCFAAEESEVVTRDHCDPRMLATRSSLRGATPLDGFDPARPCDSGEPAVVEHAFGTGRAIYINADVGSGYTHNPYPPLKRFVAALVRRTPPPIDIEAPKVIEATAATRPGGEIMVHLLNCPVPYFGHDRTGQSAAVLERYILNLEEIVPVRDITIRFNDVRPGRAWMPLADRTLEIRGDPPTVVVPEVHVHEVVLLEQADHHGHAGQSL